MKKSIFMYIFIFLTACTNSGTEIKSTQVPEATPIKTQSPTVSPSITPIPEVIYKKIGEYTTPMTSKDKNRIFNIKLAASKIESYEIGAGCEMSFNDVVGDTGEAQGYKKAVIYVDGKKEKGYGGGVCQLSSTLYNAALAGDLEIIERHSHNGPEVKYVPKDRDAAVAYGLKDLKIKNKYDKPILIKSEINKNGVTVILETQENQQ